MTSEDRAGPNGPAGGAGPGGPAGGARTRDSAATRRALLAAARELFAAEGYDGTTVRAVAERAGVNQALLFRHFGSKEGLFAEAVTGQALQVLHDGPVADLLPRTLAKIMGPEGDPDPGTLFFAALRSTGSPEASATIRDELRAAYGGALAGLADTTDEADAALRSDLVLAWLLGIALLRKVIRTEPMVSADPGTVIAHVTRATDALLGREAR
ncbi:TetR/AcrR family transcriptional regulator [Pseudonocardia ailaonensis]|uniref:TetR/AcrR family transcriptional regulator n=1 Tax=Pseudonocardia ailaonensis TaxID=367279 RepID=A0ABN2MT67_9PSEU